MSTGATATPRSLPVGTVTFLRTDVEGSMRLMQALGAAWDAVNSEHLALIAGEVAAHGGVIVRTEGDALFAAFPEAGAGVAAAVAAQRALADHPWPAEGPVLVRMGLHTGEAHAAGDDYGGFDVNRAARIAAVGHGGQVILSGTTAALVADRLPSGCALRELGRYVLRDLARPEEIVQVDVAGLPTDFPPLRAGRPTIGNLDVRLTSFVGREREVEDLTGLLARSRLVTLTGPGGIGKSSLATEVARTLEPDYRDGAWFVPLATVLAPGDVLATIAHTIGLFDGPGRSAVSALPDFVAERSMILILDNFEQVMDAAADVATVLRAAPTSRVIVTSRAPLHLTGEQEYPVATLGRTDSAAIRLFVDRARAVRPGFEPGADALAIERICALLDGLPLGIELAAARVAMLPVSTILDRLEADLPLPGTGLRDTPARQRTLDGAVAWSHDLLEPRLQRVLHRLAVFQGGFALDQAQVVVADDQDDRDILDDVASLVDQSLLARDPTRQEPRFGLLRTIQSFAASRLREDGDAEAVRRRHAGAFLALAREAQEHEATARQPAWIARLAADEANLRAALRWAIETEEVQLALPLVASLWRFWQQDGHLAEGRAMAEAALALPGAEEPTIERMWAVGAVGSLAYWQADIVRSRALYEEQLRLAEGLGDQPGIADAMFNLCSVVFVGPGSGTDLRRLMSETRARYEALGDARGVAHVDWGLGNMLIDAGDPEGAQAVFLECLVRFEALGDAQYHNMSAASLAWTSFLLGHRTESIRWAAQGLQESYALWDVGTTTISLHIGVLMAVLLGDAEVAAQVAGAFEAGSERYGVRPPAALARFLGEMDPFQMARDALSPEQYQLAHDAGRRMSIGEAVALVTDLIERWEQTNPGA